VSGDSGTPPTGKQLTTWAICLKAAGCTEGGLVVVDAPSREICRKLSVAAVGQAMFLRIGTGAVHSELSNREFEHAPPAMDGNPQQTSIANESTSVDVPRWFVGGKIDQL
jgi:hypothetical protein